MVISPLKAEFLQVTTVDAATTPPPIGVKLGMAKLPNGVLVTVAVIPAAARVASAPGVFVAATISAGVSDAGNVAVMVSVGAVVGASSVYCACTVAATLVLTASISKAVAAAVGVAAG